MLTLRLIAGFLVVFCIDMVSHSMCFGQVVAHEREAPDEITERVAALRQGSEVNGRPWLEQELRGLTVPVLRSVATTLGVAIKEEGRGGRFLTKEDLVSKITTKFLPEVGDVLMSL